MTKQNETRHYPFADADLTPNAKGLSTSINRDMTDFAGRNITNVTLADLEILIDDFDNMPTDKELLGEWMAATDVKNKTMEDVKIAIRPIRNMAELVYKGKGKYTSFGFEDMAHMSGNDLYQLVKRVVRVGTKCLAELSTQGLTQAQLTDLQNMATLLDTQIDNAEDKQETRDLETQQRIQKGNALWDKMVELASIGKSIYVDTNPAKYNDYVLTTTPPSDAPPTETPVK